jgi:hypothetical protein
MEALQTLAKILGVEAPMLEALEREMATRTGTSNLIHEVAEENQARAREALERLGLSPVSSADTVRAALRRRIAEHEEQLLHVLRSVEGEDIFKKAAAFARQIAKAGTGFFLKKSYAEEILRERPPEKLLEFLGSAGIEKVLERHDVTETFSALRFIESDEWMHETFEAAYSHFTPEDFEEREIDIKVLGPEWREVAEKFVAKKHHNVSHLKEFGVIFLNPIAEDVPGKFLRDFALLLHYFHEVQFYSKLFSRYAAGTDFAAHLKSLLRGDVKEGTAVGAGEWLIVQRYLFKENPQDTRLFLPRVNPESMHWARGERDLALLGAEREDLDLEFWQDLDWVAAHHDHDIVSFDLEDNAMSEVSFREGKKENLFYHQREAMWTKLFSEYAGGEAETEKLLIENFEYGVVKF